MFEENENISLHFDGLSDNLESTWSETLVTPNDDTFYSKP